MNRPNKNEYFEEYADNGIVFYDDKYISDLEKYCDELENQISSKEEKYKWHTDPNDLPKCNELIDYYSVDVIVKIGDNAYEIGWYNFIQNRWICPMAHGAEIKAWKYIEPFEEDRYE